MMMFNKETHKQILYLNYNKQEYGSNMQINEKQGQIWGKKQFFGHIQGIKSSAHIEKYIWNERAW